jgi:hypothetical protein
MVSSALVRERGIRHLPVVGGVFTSLDDRRLVRAMSAL